MSQTENSFGGILQDPVVFESIRLFPNVDDSGMKIATPGLPSVTLIVLLSAMTVFVKSGLAQNSQPPPAPVEEEATTEVPTGPETDAETGQNQTPSPPAAAATPDESSTPPPPRRTPRRRPPVRRSIRLARAPNMFGDFFNSSPCLFHEQVLMGGADTLVPEILSPLAGITQNPGFGGGPRTKVSDNFSPIPQHRVYAQTHYFHNLYSTEFEDSFSDGGVSGSESAWLTTLGFEVPLNDGNASVEFRLPLLHAPNTNNVLVDGLYGEVGNQSASSGPVNNLSVIFKNVLLEEEDRLISGGIAFNLPTAEDVSGRVGLMNYSVENGTTNVIPFLAAVFQLQQGWMFQIHTQLDVPLGGDDFRFSEVSVPLIAAPESGTFGTFEESILGSIDMQLARQWYRSPDNGWIQNVTGVMEARLTQALSNSKGIKGSAAELDGLGGTEVIVSYRQKDTQATYLNLTFGVQIDFRDNWHMRLGQVVPLIDNGFTSETLIQLEKRL